MVGALLVRWHYIALLAPLALIIMEWRRGKVRMLLVLFAGIVFAALQALTDTRIRMIRLDSPVPISSLSRNDPVRRHFGLLHGLSSMLLVAQVVMAAAAVVLVDDPPLPPPADSAPHPAAPPPPPPPPEGPPSADEVGP